MSWLLVLAAAFMVKPTSAEEHHASWSPPELAATFFMVFMIELAPERPPPHLPPGFDCLVGTLASLYVL